jgi:hypothetical protein
MTVLNRKLKFVTFTLSGTAFQCQLSDWTLENNSDDGDKRYTYCGPPESDGEFREETEPDFALTLKFFSDWRAGGISDFLWLNDDTDALFVLDHHPDIVGEHVRWSGTVRIKAPNVGGEARTTEVTECTLQIIGMPTYARI